MAAFTRKTPPLTRREAIPERGDCPVCPRTNLRLRITDPFRGHVPKHSFRNPDSGMATGCDYTGPPKIYGSRHLIAKATDKAALLGAADNTSPAGTSYGWPESVAAKVDRLLLHGEITNEDRADRLAAWWRGAAEAEIDMVVAKAIEYGATDLRDIGRQLAEMGGRDLDQGTHGDMIATEIGIVFYVLGKVSRLVAAVKEGRTPSRDTWLDIGVYARMAQRVHESGGWPGV